MNVQSVCSPQWRLRGNFFIHKTLLEVYSKVGFNPPRCYIHVDPVARIRVFIIGIYLFSNVLRKRSG